MKRPRLRAGLVVVPGPPLHVRGGDREVYLFDGAPEPWIGELLGILDGRDLVALDGVPQTETDRAIDRLAAAGVLEEAASVPRRARVRLVGESPLWPRLRPLLDGEVVEEGDEVAVVHEEVMRPSEMRGWNRARLDSRRPWLLVSLQGSWARVGPLFVPGETACWGCYRARLASHRAHPDAERAWAALDRSLGPSGPDRHAAAVAALAAAEVERFTRRHAPPLLAGRVFVVDLETLEGGSESVWAVPGCPDCGA
ncbi:MAG: TOMM precursor leader peptide-binding protein [Planctomycetota bacterium]|mgnify:CR=1 FL=1